MSSPVILPHAVLLIGVIAVLTCFHLSSLKLKESSEKKTASLTWVTLGSLILFTLLVLTVEILEIAPFC